MGRRLPGQQSELIGRESEVESVVALLRDPATHLITLTGPGGVGKTRLSLAVADRATGLFPGGVWFVSLATVETTKLVLPEIASELGVRDPEGDETIARIAERLGALPTMIVLDNLEHVIAVAPEVARLLQTAPSLKIMSTSREPLMVRGEIAYPVHPLPTEPGEGDELSAAERLFVTCAAEASFGFGATKESIESIREICRHLGGSRWLSSSPPPGSRYCHLSDSWQISTGSSMSWCVVPVICRPDNRRCVPPSNGAIACSMTISRHCSVL
ncbi:MAG: hypothetical protein R2839_01070 [Thermomicrobiales bacterium]